MRAEGGQALFDALLVADVGADAVEADDLAARLRRYMQAGQTHAGQQADGLQGDGLAAGIGAGDDHGADAAIQLHVYRHHFRRRDQRVAGLDQTEQAAVVHLGRGAVQIIAELALGHDEIDAGQDDQIGLDLRRETGDHQRQPPQDGGDLLFFFLAQGGQLVVQLHHGQRLHEEGGPGTAGIVDHAGDLAPVFLLYRHHVDIVADGDDGILQIAGGVGIADQAVQPGPHLLRFGRFFAADGIQAFGGVVVDGQIGADGLFHRAFQGADKDQRAAQPGQIRKGALYLAEKDLGGAGCPAESGDLHQLLRIQHAADLSLAQMGPDVPQTAAAEQRIQPQQLPGLVRLGQQPAGLVAVRDRTQRFRQFPGRREIAVFAQLSDYLVELQLLQGAFIHVHGSSSGSSGSFSQVILGTGGFTRPGTGVPWYIPSSWKAAAVWLRRR